MKECQKMSCLRVIKVVLRVFYWLVVLFSSWFPSEISTRSKSITQTSPQKENTVSAGAERFLVSSLHVCITFPGFMLHTYSLLLHTSCFMSLFSHFFPPDSSHRHRHASRIHGNEAPSARRPTVTAKRGWNGHEWSEHVQIQKHGGCVWISPLSPYRPLKLPTMHCEKWWTMMDTNSALIDHHALHRKRTSRCVCVCVCS